MSKKNLKKQFLAASVASAVVASSVVPAASAAVTSFKDVPGNAFYYEAVKNLSARGVINGYADGTFKPGQEITRAQLASFIAKSLKLDTKSVKNPNFKDVKTNYQFYGAISALAEKGIINGFDDKTFRPNQIVKRSEAAKIIAAAYNLKDNKAVASKFKDVKSNNWFAGAVGALIEKKITSGKTPTSFDPNGHVKRSEAAVFIYKGEQAQIKPAKLGAIEENKVTIDGKEYSLTDDVKKILNPANKEILTNGLITFEESNNKISKITYLELNASGKEPAAGQAEFSQNAILDGKNGVIDGSLVVNGNFVTVKNLTANNGLHITNKLLNDFYGETLTIKGTVQVEGGDNNTVVFKDSKLDKVVVDKVGTHVKLAGSTTATEVEILTASTLTAVEKIPTVSLAAGVKDVTLNAKVTNLVLPAGTNPASVIKNFDQVKRNIEKVNGAPYKEEIPAPPTNNDGGGSTPPPPAPTPTVVKVTDLTITEDTFVEGTSMESILRAQIENPNNKELSVTLVKAGQTEALATLKDDGNVGNGDDIIHDGVYSTKKDMSALSLGTHDLKVIVKHNSQTVAESAVFQVTITKALTDEQVQAINQVSTTAETAVEKWVADNGPVSAEKMEEAKASVTETLSSTPNVTEAAPSAGSNGVWYATGAGTLGGVVIPQTTAASSASIKMAAAKSSFSAASVTSASEAPEYLGNNKAVILTPFSAATDDLALSKADFSEIKSKLDASNKFSVTHLDGNAATVESFKDLSKYGLIILNTHGTTLYGKNLKSKAELSDLDADFAEAKEKIVLLTGEQVTKEKNTAYQKDLKKGRLVVVNGYYAITPAFAKKYWDDMPNSLMINASSYSASNDSIQKHFIKNGGTSYLGFSNNAVVTSAVKSVVTGLLGGSNLGTAFNSAKGSSSLTLSGSQNISFLVKSIQNGGFENGTVTGWTADENGDVRVLSQLGESTATTPGLLPREGKYMGIISTGLGSLDDSSDSSIEQTFEIPEGVTALKFDYNVVSEEPFEYVGSVFNDKFQASLITGAGKELLAEESVNESEWVEQVNVDLPGGDKTAYITGWKRVTFDVSKLQGQTVTLKFHTWDEGDSIYDTGALLDRVQLTNSTYTSLQFSGGEFVVPDSNLPLEVEFKDQYGDVWTKSKKEVNFSLANQVTGITLNGDGTVSIADTVAAGTKYTVKATSGDLSATKTFTVTSKSTLAPEQVKENGSSLTVSGLAKGDVIKIYPFIGSENPIKEFVAEGDTLVIPVENYYTYGDGSVFITRTEAGKSESDKVQVVLGSYEENPEIMFSFTGFHGEGINLQSDVEFGFSVATKIDESFAQEEDSKYRLQVTLLKHEEDEPQPVSNVTFKYNAFGQSDFGSSFVTDQEGKGYYTPVTGLTSQEWEALKSDAGLATNFKTTLKAGNYILFVSLVNDSTGEMMNGYGPEFVVQP